MSLAEAVNGCLEALLGSDDPLEVMATELPSPLEKVYTWWDYRPNLWLWDLQLCGL